MTLFPLGEQRWLDQVRNTDTVIQTPIYVKVAQIFSLNDKKKKKNPKKIIKTTKKLSLQTLAAVA